MVITKQIPIEVPPEARKPCPPLSPKPSGDMPEDQVFAGWSSDRTARNICEARRAAAVEAFCDERLRPLLAKLDPTLRSGFGQDFGRSGDLSVIHPFQVRLDLTLSVPFLLELRDVPFESQKQIVFYIRERLPRFFHAALDATGNGAFLAEVCRQKFGVSLVSEIKLNTTWYLLNMPKLKAAFEDASIELPMDDDILGDYRGIAMVKGIAKVPDNARTMGADGYERHGDAAIAGALAVFASEQDSGDVGAGSSGERAANDQSLDEFIGSFGQVELRADINEFLRM